MNVKKVILLSLVVAVIAMAMVEVDPTTWKARESAKLSISKIELFKFLTDPSKTPEVKNIRHELNYIQIYVQRPPWDPKIVAVVDM
jgi:hypothetical protein